MTAQDVAGWLFLAVCAVPVWPVVVFIVSRAHALSAPPVEPCKRLALAQKKSGKAEPAMNEERPRLAKGKRAKLKRRKRR